MSTEEHQVITDQKIENLLITSGISAWLYGLLVTYPGDWGAENVREAVYEAAREGIKAGWEAAMKENYFMEQTK